MEIHKILGSVFNGSSKNDEEMAKELGYSFAMYKNRASNSRKLLFAAWSLEIIAAIIGLIIAAIIGFSSLENLEVAGVEITQVIRWTALMGALPFVMCAIVELMKIPIVTLVYQSKSTLSQVFFVIALCLITFITFETTLSGLQQSYQLRIGNVSALTVDLDTTRTEIEENESQLYGLQNIDISTFEDSRQENYRQRTEAVADNQRLRNERRNQINQDIGSQENANANYQRLLDALGEVEQGRDDQVAQLDEEGQQRRGERQVIFEQEYSGCSGMFAGTCRSRVSEENNEALTAIEDDINNRRDTVLRDAQVRIDELTQQINEALEALNLGQTDVDARRSEALDEANDYYDQEEQRIIEELNRQLASINLAESNATAGATTQRIEQLNERIEQLRDDEARLSVELDSAAETNQIYQIAKIAFSLFSDEAEEESVRPSDLNPSFVDKVAAFWFGSLALIVSSIGIILALGSLVLKYQPNYQVKGTYFSKILRSFRMLLVEKRKRAKREPKIEEKIVIKKETVFKEVPKEVVKEVPVEKIVIKEVEVPKFTTEKEFVYVPFYSDDPEDAEKAKGVIEDLKNLSRSKGK